MAAQVEAQPTDRPTTFHSVRSSEKNAVQKQLILILDEATERLQGEEHPDFEGIHKKICKLLLPDKDKMPFAPSKTERERRDQELASRKMEIMTICRTTGEKFLYEDRFSRAVPAAMESLKLAMEVYGVDSIELVPSYLILAEASIGLSQLTEAEEYVAQAEWTILKRSTDCPNSVRHKFFRIQGLLSAAVGNFQAALRSLADDIYHVSLDVGPHHVRAAGAYYHMGNIFVQKNELLAATSLFIKVLQIWQNHLVSLATERTRALLHEALGPRQIEALLQEGLDEAEKAEAIKEIHSVSEYLKTATDVDPNLLISCEFTLAVLYFMLVKFAKAREYGISAGSQLGSCTDTSLRAQITDFTTNLDPAERVVQHADISL